MSRDLSNVVSNFQIDGAFIEGMPYGNGHINETFVGNFKTSEGKVRYIHQRVNHTIFKDVPLLMGNIERVTNHIAGKVEAAGGDPRRGTLTVIPALDGKNYFLNDEGEFWRTYVFLEGAQTYEVVEDLQHVYNASKAFGEFQKALADLPAPRLSETIPNFHHTRKRFEALQDAVAKDVKGRAASVKDEIAFAENRAADASRIVDLLESGALPERVTHNDTKLNNVMLDSQTGEATCVIDLDTVMPGTVAYDFGDSVRIGASTGAEDEKDLSKVSMDLDMFERLTHGYLDASRSFLTPVEIAQLAFAAKLLTFECGMRFLADHLSGDVYFRTHRENHNLDRCRTQFKMVADMEEKMDRMEEIIQKHAAS